MPTARMDEISRTTRSRPSAGRCGPPYDATARFAFQSTNTVDKDDDVFVMDADGKHIRNVSQTEEVNERQISWAPGGRALAYTSNANGHDAIVAANADGSGSANVTQNIGGADSWAVWGPRRCAERRPVIFALRVPAIALAVVVVLVAFRAYRRGRTARFTLVFAVAIAVGVAAVAVSPSIVYAVRDRLGIPADRLSGLVVALVIVTGVQMLMLLWILGRLDASR